MVFLCLLSFKTLQVGLALTGYKITKNFTHFLISMVSTEDVINSSHLVFVRLYVLGIYRNAACHFILSKKKIVLIPASVEGSLIFFTKIKLSLGILLKALALGLYILPSSIKR